MTGRFHVSRRDNVTSGQYSGPKSRRPRSRSQKQLLRHLWDACTWRKICCWPI